MRRRPEPVLVERVAADRQRVVDPDRLARDLLAVAVDRQVGREVGRLAGVEAGRLEGDVLDQQQPGRADRLDRQRAPFGDDEALLVAEPGGRGGRDQEQDQTEVGEQRRELGVLVAVAVEVARAVLGGRLADAEAVPPQHVRGRPPPGTPAIAARSGRSGSKNGSGWATRTSLTPRHSRGVRSSVQITIDTISTTSAPLNQGERKIVNTHSRSRVSTSGRARAAGRSVRGGPRARPRSRSPSAARSRGPGGSSSRRPPCRARKMIWATAKSTDVNRRHSPYPSRAGRLRPDGRAEVGAGDLAARDGSSLLDGAERRDGPRGVRDGVAPGRPAGPRRPRARPTRGAGPA